MLKRKLNGALFPQLRERFQEYTPRGDKTSFGYLKEYLEKVGLFTPQNKRRISRLDPEQIASLSAAVIGLSDRNFLNENSLSQLLVLNGNLLSSVADLLEVPVNEEIVFGQLEFDGLIQEARDELAEENQGAAPAA